MNLYRGQGVGPLGFWWSDRLEDAKSFARAAGRSHLVLRMEVDEAFAWRHRQFEADAGHGAWYRIPHEALVAQAFAVEVVGGRIGLPHHLINTYLKPKD